MSGDLVTAITSWQAVPLGTNMAAVAYPNTSGISPLDLRVLVLLDAVEEKVGSIILPASETDAKKFAMMKATLVAVGENAFDEARKNPAFIAPKPGDRIMIAKFGGIGTQGRDGKEYRIMNDNDVIARLEA